MTQQRCNGTNKAGERCGGKALPGSVYCLVHDPARIVDIAEARRKGGAATSHKARARREFGDAALSPAELAGVVGQTIRGVLDGTKPAGVGQAIAALVRTALEAGRTADLEDRMAAIERKLGERAS